MALLPRWITLLLLSLLLTTGQSMSVQLWEFDTEESNLTSTVYYYTVMTFRMTEILVWGRPAAAMRRRAVNMTENPENLIMPVFRSCTCKFLLQYSLDTIIFLDAP